MNSKSGSSSSPLPRPLARRAFDLALGLYEALRGRIRDRARIFAVRVEPDAEPVVCSLYLGEDQGRGLVVYTGSSALRHCQEVTAEHVVGDRAARRGVFTVRVLPVRQIPERFRDWLAASGCSSVLAPQFFTSEGARGMRSLRRREVEHLAQVMELVLAAAELDLLELATVPRTGPVFLPCLRPAPGEIVPFETEHERFFPAGADDWAATRAGIAQLRVRKRAWLFGWLHRTSQVGADADWRTAIVFEEGNAQGILEMGALGVDPKREALDLVEQLMLSSHNGGRLGRPRELLCSEPDLYEMVRKELEELGVPVRLCDALPELDDLVDRLESVLDASK